jgi:transcriptional regulator with XRE-family HTH domain
MTNILDLYMPSEVMLEISAKAKTLRLQKGFKRSTLADKSGVPSSSIKRFETTGNISLTSLLKLANALGCLSDFSQLFPPIKTRTLSEIEKFEKESIPKRGKI